MCEEELHPGCGGYHKRTLSEKGNDRLWVSHRKAVGPAGGEGGGAGAGAALHREHGFRVEDTQRKLGF